MKVLKRRESDNPPEPYMYSMFSAYAKGAKNKSISLKLGDVIETEIIDIDDKGRGIGKYKDFKVIVNGGTVGDIVKLKVMKIKDTVAYGVPIEISFNKRLKELY
ncbi:hypothetical protein HS7_17330 [Sulfolobales archaeon HS-7]|nr:hypothetical protein HS7_17330 [Sulfolobales archaeon HS-7]